MYIICFFFYFRGRDICHFCWSGRIGTTIQELEEMKKELEEAKLISIPEPKDERQTSPFLTGSRVGWIFFEPRF